MSNPTEAASAALDYLKGKENPFESLARPQRLDDHFLDLHVPELLANERKLLLEIIDRYRVDEFTRPADLPATRVITILGDRGAGKTHLLQSLAYREDGKSQIMVRPSYYDMHLPFDEYLLAQLVATLLAEDEVFYSRPIEDIAGAIVPRLLRQAIRALGPTDRVFALSPSRWQRWRLLLGGAEWSNQIFERLAAALQEAPMQDMPDLIEHHGLSPEQATCLLQGHVRKYEAGPDLLAGLRRELYEAMGQAVLLKENRSLFRFLEGGYTQIANAANTRVEVVGRLLHALIEVCALVRQPVVFAFDNLERFFAPKNQFSGELVRTFWNTLAQAVDNTRGLLILLFAERGLFESQLLGQLDSFVRARIEQGVPIFGRGPIYLIKLQPPSPEEIHTLIRARVGRLLSDFPAASELPAEFPFDEKLLKEPIPATQTLRDTLLRLRDEYSRVVYEAAPKKTTAIVNWENLLDTTWKEQFAASSSKVSGSLAANLQDIHAGLGSLLQLVLPLDLDGWVLHDVQPTASIGDNPTYGIVSLLHWRPRNHTAESNGNSLKMGVGFLLARGPGMPVDLRAKFDFFRRPALGDELLIFWPAPRDTDDLAELLPTGTRAEWDKARAKKKTTLRRMDLNSVRELLVVTPWLNAAQTLIDQPVPQEALQAFIKERFQALFQLITPPVLERERIAADEN